MNSTCDDCTILSSEEWLEPFFIKLSTTLKSEYNAGNDYFNFNATLKSWDQSYKDFTA